MPKDADWNDPSHVGKSLVSIYDIMAEKFFRDSKNAERKNMMIVGIQ